ncbi:MAG TPA: hypothetical protein VLU96_09885 [Gaiellaceae bacterium]|nr:hypothetical protein [Gaiellaceae bacterium]
MRDDPSALAALAALEAELLATGWERVAPEPGAEWYQHSFRLTGSEKPRKRSRRLGGGPKLAPIPRSLPYNGDEAPVAANGKESASASPGKITVDTSVRGFQAAARRLTEAVERRDPPEHAYLHLFEALNWAVAIIDALGRPDVPIANGLRWARNSVHQEWINALETRAVLTPGPASQIIGPTVVPEWVWLPVERMPKPRTSKREPEQRRAYAEQLAGRSAREVLERFVPELTRYRSERSGEDDRARSNG